MIKKLTTLCLILVSAFAFSSCGDSKDAVVDDTVELLEEMAEAIASGDQEALEKIKERGEAIDKRAKELGFDKDDLESLSDEQKKKLKAAGEKVMKASMKKAGDLGEQLKKALGK